MTPVYKSLTPEEQAIVGNIKSLLQQLEGAVGEELPVQMSDTPDAESVIGGPSIDKCDDPNGFKGQPNKIGKDESLNSKSPHGHADQTMDELPVDDEEALSVLKALMGNRGGNIRKSARPQGRGDQVQMETLKVLKALTNKVTAQEAVIHELLGGAEMADQVLGINRVQKSAPKTPVQPSAQAVLEALGQLVVQKSERSQGPQDAGSMADVLRGTWGITE